MVELYNLDAASKVEHIQVATYRSLVDRAQQLGEQDCARLLQENLRSEEEETREVEQVLHQVGARIIGRQRPMGTGA